jgi:uncharacterized membrane protein YdfJ with MMPL/SSD domain
VIIALLSLWVAGIPLVPDAVEPVDGNLTAHPLTCGLVALALLVPLIVPMLSPHLGQEDIAATPKETTERQAFDLLAGKYGPGYNGPC